MSSILATKVWKPCHGTYAGECMYKSTRSAPEHAVIQLRHTKFIALLLV